MRLILFPVNEKTWGQFTSWYQARKLQMPPPTQDAILVGVDTGDLIAGCCLYPTMGPFCVVEYVSTNPVAGLRLRHTACLLIAHEIQIYGAMRGKNMLCFPRDKGVARMLKRAGAIESPAELCYFQPGADTGVNFSVT